METTKRITLRFRYNGQRIKRSVTLVMDEYSTRLYRERYDVEVEDFSQNGGGICITLFTEDDLTYEVFLTKDPTEVDYVNVWSPSDSSPHDEISASEVDIDVIEL